MARRRSGMRGGNGGGSGDVIPRMDWVVGGGQVIPGAATINNPSFNGSAQSLTAGSAYAHQLVVVPIPVPALNQTPTIGEMKVRGVVGSVFFDSATTAGVYNIGVGMYIAKLNSNTGVWDMRSIFGASFADATRDDWLFLRVMRLVSPANTTFTLPSCFEIPVAISRSIVLGGGEALHLQIENAAGSTGQLSSQAFVRSCISGVA